MKKYRLGPREKNGLRRVIALRDFGDVKKGDVGGYVESSNNLSHHGNCWVYDDACVWERATVYDDAQIREDACVMDSAVVDGEAVVSGSAYVGGNAVIRDRAQLKGRASAWGCSTICGDAVLTGKAINVMIEPHFVTITDDSIIVGCQVLRKSHLEADAKSVIKDFKDKLTPQIIKKYRAIVKALLMDEGKK